MNPKSISEYIQSLLNKIEDLETMNIEYAEEAQKLIEMLGNSYDSIKSLRERNEKLTTELAEAKEDIETRKAYKKTPSSVNPALGHPAFAHCPW